MSKYLLFDIGGTNTRIGVSYDGQSVTEPVIYQTPQSYQQGVAEIIKVAKSLSSEGYEFAGGGIAGPLNKDKSGIINAPNLPDWSGKPVKSDLEKALETKVSIDNDTALVGLGESVYGAGKNYNLVVYITISTGVNGVRIVDGQIDERVFGFEIGKQILDAETETSWEEMIIGDVNTPEKEAEIISLGVFNSILFWSPQVVVLGGGRMRRIDVSEVEKHLEGLLKIYPELPKVAKAELGDVGGVWGALHYLKQIKY